MENVKVELSDGVQIVRICRSHKKNALTGPMYEAMTDALGDANARQDIAVTVLTGEGDGFTAGNDIAEFAGFAQSGALGAPVLGFLKALVVTQKPLVAAVEGLAIGVGTTLLFHCDLVYAGRSARFSTPFLSLGLVPEAASSLTMPRRMGYARAFEMLCLGETFDAARAETAGIVNGVVDDGMALAVALEAAGKLAQKPPAALAAARTLMRGTSQELTERIDEEAEIFGDRLRSDEAREAFSAFLEKRPANFSKLR